MVYHLSSIHEEAHAGDQGDRCLDGKTMAWKASYPKCPPSAEFGGRPTGMSEKCTTCPVSASPATPTCDGSFARKTGSVIRLRKDYEMPLEYHGVRGR